MSSQSYLLTALVPHKEQIELGIGDPKLLPCVSRTTNVTSYLRRAAESQIFEPANIFYPHPLVKHSITVSLLACYAGLLFQISGVSNASYDNVFIL